jgi:hypothetical protein
MCNKSFAVAEWQNISDAVCCSYGMERTKYSRNWLLILYGSTCFWRHHEEKEVDNSASEYTICTLSSSARRRNFRSWTSEGIYLRFRRGRRRVELWFSWAAGVYWTTSPTIRLLQHSHTFLHRTKWTILFAIWSCPRLKQCYWGQDWINVIFSRKISEFLRLAVVIGRWCLSSERKMTLCSASM